MLPGISVDLIEKTAKIFDWKGHEGRKGLTKIGFAFTIPRSVPFAPCDFKAADRDFTVDYLMPSTATFTRLSGPGKPYRVELEPQIIDDRQGAIELEELLPALDQVAMRAGPNTTIKIVPVPDWSRSKHPGHVVGEEAFAVHVYTGVGPIVGPAEHRLENLDAAVRDISDWTGVPLDPIAGIEKPRLVACFPGKLLTRPEYLDFFKSLPRKISIGTMLIGGDSTDVFLDVDALLHTVRSGIELIPVDGKMRLYIEPADGRDDAGQSDFAISLLDLDGRIRFTWKHSTLAAAADSSKRPGDLEVNDYAVPLFDEIVASVHFVNIILAELKDAGPLDDDLARELLREKGIKLSGRLVSGLVDGIRELPRSQVTPVWTHNAIVSFLEVCPGRFFKTADGKISVMRNDELGL
jgi:hypothetical protein